MAFVAPEVVVNQFHLHPGDRVADFGAGSGHFMKPLSRAVGPDGRVFGIEIQRQLAEAITARAKSENLSNVESIWGDLEALGGTKLTEKSIDAVILSNTLSMLEDKKTALAECKRVLNKGGRLLVIDWTDSFGNMGPVAEHIVTEDTAKELILESGFTFERTFPAGEHHYGISFRLT